ncbi:sulfate ABC transporter permease subunit CysT [Erythrobacter arachoides]|uniref:Sulfate transport system permease protein CysT n=1 Tax=Aurantiacibacter arachoides TaxID=1850444 RepID=A0A845A169_9SPHN|nr:sulfate ABC transporter permease subunit CysT [Aurantiacibacter arachoides]MXO93875.1 sulfate ABC transporter permease subunit CysT [Aurantiacibacter arachoides]GGD46039.1 sulfate ABC transporter permease [Aurantiacibacter arachoides]
MASLAPGAVTSEQDLAFRSPLRSKKASRARRSIIPGFGLTMGVTIGWLSLIVLIPLSLIFVRSAGMGWEAFAAAAFSPRAIAAYKVSFGTALAAALVNAVFGLLIAWVFTRYSFPFKRVLDALIDLPFALPTAVAGIALTAIYADNGWIGAYLSSLGIQAAYNPIGITIALIFIGLPFIVRSVQPVLADLSVDVEEAALSLGAAPWQVFARVIFPAIMPALLTGFALALARGVGEYGSVIFIAGNMPFRSEIGPLLIVTQLEQYNIDGATAIALVMLLISFSMLLFINVVQAWSRHRMGV